MKRITMTVGLALCYGLFVFGAGAQDTTAPPAPSQSAMPMSHDHQMMMAQQNDINGLMDRLNKSLAAIEAEKRPAGRKEKVAAHSALLKELQTKLQAQDHMMMGMMNMGMMGKGMMGKDMMGKDMMQSCCNMAAGGAMNCGSMMKMDAEPKK